MNELIARIVQTTGLSEDQAAKAVGIILKYLNAAAPQDKMQRLFAAIPGAEDAVAGGWASGGMMGAMAAMGELTGLGLNMNQIRATSRETVDFAREKAGDDLVDEIVATVPGLRQYV